MNIEVKADALDSALDTVMLARTLEEMRSEVAGLKMQMERHLVADARLPLDGAKSANTSSTRSPFIERYIRRGIDNGVEMKSLSGATGPAGGYAVPREINMLIASTLESLSPIRAIANVVQTGTSDYRKLVATGETGAGWVTEIAARSESSTRSFTEITPQMGELYANPAASQAMLDDAAFDVETWLTDEIARKFAVSEGAAFISGNGNNQPKGFLSYPVTSESDTSRNFSTLQYVASGTTGNFASSNPQDQLIELVHSLRTPYRQGANWVMNSDTLARIRKMKTTDGAFLWQPGLIEGQAATLLGYPIIEAEDMPSLRSGSLSIAFGNFRNAYLIADRGEATLLRDPYSNKPFVHFYATKRVGGALVNSEAIKLMKFSAS